MVNILDALGSRDTETFAEMWRDFCQKAAKLWRPHNHWLHLPRSADQKYAICLMDKAQTPRSGHLPACAIFQRPKWPN